MLFLEDYIDSIETIPQDMKHYFSEMRSLDLRVNSAFLSNRTPSTAKIELFDRLVHYNGTFTSILAPPLLDIHSSA